MRVRIALAIILLVFLVAAATSLTLMLTALGVTVREIHYRADNLAQQFFSWPVGWLNALGGL